MFRRVTRHSAELIGATIFNREQEEALRVLKKHMCGVMNTFIVAHEKFHIGLYYITIYFT
jgi:hypothetical protein